MPKEKMPNPPVARDEVKVIMEKYPNIRVFESRLSSKDELVMMGWFVVYSIVFVGPTVSNKGKNFPNKKTRLGCDVLLNGSDSGS